jgi:hypothetical protein
MATNYPASIDNFVNPAGTATLNSPDHAGQHTDINDAVEAIETELGTLPKGSKASVKARLDDVDTALALVGSAARPLNTTGAYLSGSGLVQSGLASNGASISDSPALDVTGDAEWVFSVAMNDWTPAAVIDMAVRGNADPNRAWFIRLNATGTIRFTWYPTGSAASAMTATSTVAVPFSDGQRGWVKVTLDVNNGASGSDVKFFSSTDGTTFTQLGTTVTQAGVTSLPSITAPIYIFWGDANGAAPITGTGYSLTFRDGIGGTIILNADFSTQTADALAFNATSDAGIKADGLVLKGVTGQYASAPDSAALSITGDIDIKAKVTLADWTPVATNYVIAAKRVDGGNQQSFNLILTPSGTLNILTSATGAAPILENISTAATGVADGATKWIRATLDVNDGAGNRVAKFYTSDNGTTWTQLGTTVTTAGTASIFDSTAPLEIGSRNLGVNDKLVGTVHEVIIQSAYDTANNTASLVFDADFDAQTPETTSFVESSSNAAVVTMNNTNPTVTISTTRYSFGMPNLQSGSISTASLTSGNDRYQRFVITKLTIVDMVLMEVTTAPASAATVYFGLYAADTNFQPTGNALLATNLAVGASATGIFTKQFTPVTLQPGIYLLATNPSVTMTVRTLINGDAAITSTYGSSGAIVTLSRTRTAATFGNNPSEWNTITTASTVGSINYALLRWRPAS